MTILVTGYGPYGTDSINPAWETAKVLDGNVFNGHRVVSAQLPVDVKDNIKLIHSLILNYNPSIIIGLGVAPGRSVITVERFATNLLDLPQPDEGGNQPQGIPIIQEGPVAYQSTIPIRAIVQAMKGSGVPSSISYSGGTHGCNQLLYWLLHYSTVNGNKIKAGFIHLPFLHEQVAKMMESTLSMYPPSMSLETMVQGIEIAIKTSVELKHDIVQGFGSMC